MCELLKGRRALVCGASRGIGRACATRLALLGAEVTLVARDEAALQGVLAELDTGAGQAHRLFPADFTDPRVLRESVLRHIEKVGTLHILINNTGGPPPGMILDASPAQFEKAMTMHLVCNQILAQSLVPGMKEAVFGRIINIISVSVKEPIKGLGVSNTTRWAVASWAKTLASELAPFAITVNNVLPGYTDTERLRLLIADRAEKAGVSLAAIEQSMLAEVPTGRFARPEEVASAVGFLASPDASYISGINLPVDGGRMSCL